MDLTSYPQLQVAGPQMPVTKGFEVCIAPQIYSMRERTRCQSNTNPCIPTDANSIAVTRDDVHVIDPDKLPLGSLPEPATY